MFWRFFSLLWAGWLGCTLGLLPAARAADGQDPATTCVRTKTWDAYSQGWSLRSHHSATLTSNATYSMLVTFYRGNEYTILTCADAAMLNLDLLIYDDQGQLVLRDDTTTNQPSISLKPAVTQTYYVVMHARQLASTHPGARAALAILYR